MCKLRPFSLSHSEISFSLTFRAGGFLLRRPSVSEWRAAAAPSAEPKGQLTAQSLRVTDWTRDKSCWSPRAAGVTGVYPSLHVRDAAALPMAATGLLGGCVDSTPEPSLPTASHAQWVVWTWIVTLKFISLLPRWWGHETAWDFCFYFWGKWQKWHKGELVLCGLH